MKLFLASLAVLATAGSSFATTFIVPKDEELIRKSKGIVTGVVVAASAEVAENGDLETRYEIALDRVFKGPFQPGTIVPIQSPGGMREDRWTIVEGSAQFRIGDEVILFLTPYRGGWTPTDLTLGKFRLALTSAGYSVAVRDEDDIEGWDRDGEVHTEKIRLAVPFMNFIEDSVARRTPADRAYEIEAGEVLAAPPAAGPRPAGEAQPRAELFPAPSHTYSSGFYDCSLTRFPARWQTTTMNAGIPWRKSSAQNASGLADGGVSIIQTALAAWTNDCGSSVNIVYAGTTPNLKNSSDGINAIVFNDPGGHVPGSWTGSGTIAITFSSGGANHSFDNTTWVTITDSDVIFQDGYAGTQPSIEEAMTHEIGHGVGFRHADKHYLKTCTAPNCVISCSETACQTSVEDCASTAIMTATVNSSLGYTLQTWDKNAADALYPGTCGGGGATAPANVVATATSTSTVNVSWAAATGAATYNVYRSSDGTNYALAGSTSGTSFNDTGRTANTAYLYKVRGVSGVESGDSNRDLATTVIFTDDPLVPGSTRVKAVHITQLRTAVNAVRTLASLGPGSYTDPTLTAGVTVKAAHVNDLRTALNAARSSLSLPAVSYAETITLRVTKIKASHLTELRNGVK